MPKSSLTRRQLLRRSAAAAATAAAVSPFVGSQAAKAQGVAAPAGKLLFTITASGGGSITDSFLAQGASDIVAGERNNLICYPDQYVGTFGGDVGTPGSALKYLDLPDSWRTFLVPNGPTGNGYLQQSFLTRHGADTAVLSTEVTSVNHAVAQKRAMTGAGIHDGRTISEAVAERWGQDVPLPHVNMAQGGYLESGDFRGLPLDARAEAVAQPLFFPLTTDGMRGMRSAPGADGLGQAPTLEELPRARALMARARGVRNSLDAQSTFGQTFQCSELLQRFIDKRASATDLEAQDLITNLLYLRENELDLSPYGLAKSDQAEFVRNIVEPNPDGSTTSVFVDPLYAQVTLAYLLTRYGYTSAVTLGPALNTDVNILTVNPPLSFDYSHSNHVSGQAVMWGRVLDAADKLIQLLKATPVPGGGTMWDRSMVHIASDFGRDKLRVTPGTPESLEDGISTGHHLSNGTILVSKMIRGGRAYGGVSPETMHHVGFDPVTGQLDASRKIREHHVYSAIAHAFDIDFAAKEQLPILFPA